MKVLPHGNSKRDSPFIPISHSTKEEIAEMCKENKKPKEIEYAILQSRGGITGTRSAAEICRNRQQISNTKYRLQVNDCVLACTDLAKLQEGTKTRMVRDVRCAPEFTVFLANDTQLNEIERFCTKNHNFRILTVDTTFNIGDYYVSITTHRHPMLLTKKEVEPVMIGPALIHQKKIFASYYKLPSSMVQEQPALVNVKVFGTDGDKNLSQAFSACFGTAHHLLCDIHMQDNIERKLRT